MPRAPPSSSSVSLMYGVFKVSATAFLVFLKACRLCWCVAYVIAAEAAKKHHHLNLNTLGGHTDCITAFRFLQRTPNPATMILCSKLLEETPFLQPSKMTYP
ncbi:hypothetical protein ZWY2020_002711 [Hordeum vulgare]|nr:hypothetical protein ZWY2020_002711 [Hordeum vulgare]